MKSQNFLQIAFALFLFSLPAFAAEAAPPKAQAQSSIVLAADAQADEKLAAQELQKYLQKISGADVAIGAQPTPGQFPIYVGASGATPELLAAIKAKGDDPASFLLKIDQDAARVVGLSPQGTLFGAYELLEQIGVRWFMPGELGTVIPETKTVALRAQETIQVPSFRGRWMNAGKNFPEWGRHMRMGGPYFPSAHGLPGFNRAKENAELFKEHPEYFALVNGQRTTRQVNISNPEVLKIAVEETKKLYRKNPDAPWIGMGPNDGGGFCEDVECRALDSVDWDPFVNENSVTDRYIWFFNQVLDGIKDEFPGKKMTF